MKLIIFAELFEAGDLVWLMLVLHPSYSLDVYLNRSMNELKFVVERVCTWCDEIAYGFARLFVLKSLLDVRIYFS